MKTLFVLLALLGFLNAADTTRGPIGFEAYDKNKDGIITKEEFDAVKAERMSANATAGMPMRNRLPQDAARRCRRTITS